MIHPDKLRALDQAATPGPWKVFALFGGGGPYEVCRAEDYAMGGVCVPTRKNDAALIAHLRNSVPAILAMAEREKRMREALERLSSSFTGRWAGMHRDRSAVIAEVESIARRALGEEKA